MAGRPNVTNLQRLYECYVCLCLRISIKQMTPLVAKKKKYLDDIHEYVHACVHTCAHMCVYMCVCGNDPFLDLGPDNGLLEGKALPSGVGQEAD